MLNNEKTHGALSRRSFLRTAGIAAAGSAAISGTAFAGLAAADDPGEIGDRGEETYVSFCRGNCGSYGCGLDVHVRQGKVSRVSPHIYEDADPATKGRSRACLRGLSNLGRLYAPDRIDYPMRRVEGTPRGGGEWERIGWDEAVSEIVEKWTRIREEYGNSAIAQWPIYGNNGKAQTNLAWPRLASALGMTTIQTGADWALIYTTPKLVMGLGIGSDGPMLAESAKNVIIWGANPAETWPHEYRFILDAQRNNGAKVTVIDPRCSSTTTQADNHVTLRPATDPAFAMGVCKYLIDNEMVDIDFLKNRSTAPCLVDRETGLIVRMSDFGYEPQVPQPVTLFMCDDLPYVWDLDKQEAVPTSEANNPALEGEFNVGGRSCTTTFELLKNRLSEWTVEKTCEVCDVSEDDIALVASALANGPTSLMMGNGAGHYTNSHAYFHASLTAAILTGNFFKPGAGWANAGVAAGFAYSPGSTWASPEGAIPGPSVSSLDFAQVVESGECAGEPLPIKSVLVYAGNPFGNTPNRQAILKALDKIDFIVVSEMSMTDTAAYADLILPAAHWFEHLDIGGFAYIPYAHIGEKAVEPSFERMSDFDMVHDIANGMGLGELFSATLEDVLRESVEETETVDLEGNAITWDRLASEKAIRTIPDGYFEDTILQDGRLYFYLEYPVSRFGKEIDVERERLPYFEPPAEAWPEDVPGYPRNELAEKYPLMLHSLHTRFTTHTTYNHVEWLTELRGNGPTVNMHPLDAAERSLQEGNMVRVYNDRGYVVVKLLFDEGLKRGIVNIPHGWGYDQFIEGHYQDLTTNATHNYDGNECYYDCLCEVELFEGSDQ